MKPLKQDIDITHFGTHLAVFEGFLVRLDDNCQAYGKRLTKKERKFLYKLKMKSFRVLDSQKRMPFIKWLARLIAAPIKLLLKPFKRLARLIIAPIRRLAKLIKRDISRPQCNLWQSLYSHPMHRFILTKLNVGSGLKTQPRPHSPTTRPQIQSRKASQPLHLDYNKALDCRKSPSPAIMILRDTLH